MPQRALVMASFGKVLLSLFAPSTDVPIVAPELTMPKQSPADDADWSFPVASAQYRTASLAHPRPAPRLESQTAAVPVEVLVFAIVHARVEPAPPSRPSSVMREAPVSLVGLVVELPEVVRAPAPDLTRIVTVHDPPLVESALNVTGKVSPVVPS